MREHWSWIWFWCFSLAMVVYPDVWARLSVIFTAALWLWFCEDERVAAQIKNESTWTAIWYILLAGGLASVATATIHRLTHSRMVLRLRKWWAAKTEW